MSTQNFELKSEFKTSPNIAVIKYWGKLEDSYILPLNTSLGFTLNTDDLCTQTKVVLSSENKEDSLILNGKSFAINDRLERILTRFRSLYLPNLIEKLNKKHENLNLTTENFKYFKIESVNDFPTASGLASSASGLAAISVCLCDIFELPDKLSEIARLGSGSACRSVYGGLVQWSGPQPQVLDQFYSADNNRSLKSYTKDQLEDLSKTCVSKQVFENNDMFKKIKILIFCAHFSAKEVPSTGGMKQSVQTSDLLQYRVQNSVLKNIEQIRQAFEEQNYNKFADITIKDSNQFHSVCLDTQPPIFYLNEFSKFLISIVEKLNQILPVKIAYTYDAGPHGVLFIHEDSFDVAFRVFSTIFSFTKEMLNKKGQNTFENLKQGDLQEEIQQLIQYFAEKVGDKPSYVIQTDVGSGPQKL